MRGKAGNRGVTLVELIVVVTIVIILSAVLNFSFQGWMGRYNVESQIRQMYSDLMEARISAMQRNRLFFVRFPDASSYEIYEDTNPSPDGNGALNTTLDRRLDSFPKTLRYALVWGGGNISVDQRGMVKSPNSIISVNTTLNADYDCIQLSPTRISLGKMAGGSCVIK